MKKLFCLVIILCLFGCSSDKIVTVDGSVNSKTYLFFKKITVDNYYVSFFDKNGTDDTKIIMAREGNKYYYEIDGDNKQKIIQKDGVKYTIMNNGYYMEESELYDYSYGILPDKDKIKNQKYKTGFRKMFGKRFSFEEYTNDKDITTYYFDGDKLNYISYLSPLQEIILKFDKFGTVKSNIFEISEDLLLLTY